MLNKWAKIASRCDIIACQTTETKTGDKREMEKPKKKMSKKRTNMSCTQLELFVSIFRRRCRHIWVYERCQKQSVYLKTREHNAPEAKSRTSNISWKWYAHTRKKDRKASTFIVAGCRPIFFAFLFHGVGNSRCEFILYFYFGFRLDKNIFSHLSVFCLLSRTSSFVACQVSGKKTWNVSLHRVWCVFFNLTFSHRHSFFPSDHLRPLSQYIEWAHVFWFCRWNEKKTQHKMNIVRRSTVKNQE